MAEHVHYFRPVIRHDGPYGFEWISHYEPCECGMTHGQHVARALLDPVANTRAAAALARSRTPFAPWRGTSYLP